MADILTKPTMPQDFTGNEWQTNLPEVVVLQSDEDYIRLLMRVYGLNREEAEAAAFLANLLYIVNTGDLSSLPEGYRLELHEQVVLTGYGGLKRVTRRSIVDSDGNVVAKDADPYIAINANPLSDPADNFLNDLIFDAATLGRYGAVKGAFSTTKNLADLYDGAVKGVSTVGKYMSPGPYVNRLATGLFRTSPGTARIWANAADAATAAGFAGYGLGKFAQDPNPETGALAVLYSMPMWGPGKAALGAGRNYFNTAIKPNVGIGVYETPNGRIFGGRFGNYAGGVRLDAPMPSNRIGIANINTPSSPITGGRVMSNEDIAVGDLMRLENGRIGYVTKVGENGVKVKTRNGDVFNISKDSAKSIKLDNPEIPRGAVIEKIVQNGDDISVREYTFTGNRDHFGGIEVLDSRGNTYPVSYDELVNSGDYNITSSLNDVILSPSDLMVEGAMNFGNALRETFGKENLNKLRNTINAGLNRLKGIGRRTESIIEEVPEATAVQEPTVVSNPQTPLSQVVLGTVVPAANEPLMVVTVNKPVKVINKPAALSPLTDTPNYPRYHFNGKNYIKIRETPEGDPVLVEYSHEVISPRKGVNTETTIEKNTFKNQAISIDENGIPETKLGDSYVDSEGITHVLNVKNSDGTVGVLNTKTGEIEPTNPLDFIKARMKSTNGNLATSLNTLLNTSQTTSEANPLTEDTDMTTKLLLAGIFKEEAIANGNNSDFNGTDNIRKFSSPVYGTIRIGEVPYRVVGDNNGVLELMDPKSTRVIKTTMADLLGGKETVEVVQTGTTYFSKGPSASSKVTINGDEVYYPGTKFKDFGIRTGKRSPYRQPNFRKDVAIPLAKVLFPEVLYGGLYGVDKLNDDLVSDLFFPWKWDLSSVAEKAKNTFSNVLTNDSTVNANGEVDARDIVNLGDSSNVEDDNTATGNNNPEKSEVVDNSTDNTTGNTNDTNSDDLGDDYSSSLSTSTPTLNTQEYNDKLLFLKARQDTSEAMLNYMRFSRMTDAELSKLGIDKSDLEGIKPLRGKEQRDRIFDWYWYKYKRR